MLFQKLGLVKNFSERCEFWSYHVKSDETRTRLHNFFPAYQVLEPDGPLHLIASREHLGRGDTAGPSLLITRASRKVAFRGSNKTPESACFSRVFEVLLEPLKVLQERFRPFLIIFDAHGLAVTKTGDETPSLIYHESIFAPELVEQSLDEEMVLCSLPDARFEQFCSEATLRMVEPEERSDVTNAWRDIDGALLALTEYISEARNETILEVHRAALRLRGIMLSLPVPIRAYEQSLLASGTPEESCALWSTKSVLQYLETRRAQMAALGEWEELLVSELLTGFHRLERFYRNILPNRRPFLRP